MTRLLAILCFILACAAFLAAYFQSPAVLFILLGFAIAAIFLFRRVWDFLAARERALTRHTIILEQIAQAASQASDTNTILMRALDTILETTHAAAGRVWLGEAGVFQNTVQRGMFPETLAELATLTLNDSSPGDARAQNLAGDEWATLRGKGFVELIRAPIRAHDHVTGLIDVAARHRGELDASTVDLLTAIGRALGPVIENARAAQATRARQAQVENLYKAGMDVSSKLNLGQVIATVTERGRALVDADAAALCLWDDQKRWLVVGTQSGPSEAFEFKNADDSSGVRRIAQRIALLRVDAAHHDDTCTTCALIRAPYRESHLEVPLRTGDHVIGCLCVSNAAARLYSDHDVELLSGLAEQAAIAIENARAFDRAGNTATAIERERLAREMHDTLAQVLGFVSTKSQAAREFLDRGQIETARKQIDQLTQLSLELYEDVREVILGLRSAISPEKTLLTTLANYMHSYSEHSHIDTELIVEDGARDLIFAPAVELQLIRIVQESLTNVRKHAHARRAVVRFARATDHIEIRVEDDGRGFDPSHIARGDWPQFGLQSMRERAESVGGAFQVISQPGAGTKVVMQIPVGYLGGH